MKRLIAKGVAARGYRIGFELKGMDADRNVLEAPAGYDMLHAPEGGAWPRCSLLVMRFPKKNEKPTDEDMAGAPKHYFGRTYRAKKSTLPSSFLPPKELSAWTRVAEVSGVYYFRPGTRAPGYYKHHFGKRRLVGMFKRGKAILYKRRNAYRLELGRGCVLDERGIIVP